MDLGLTHRRALVMGASKGLGFSAAKALADEGARVFLNARNADELTRRDAMLGGVGFHAGDIREPGVAEQAVTKAAAAMGGLDIVVANTGAPPGGDWDDLNLDDWDAAYLLTLKSTVRLIRSALPHLRGAEAGRIVLITSVGVREPLPGHVLSNAFLTAATAAAKTLAREVALSGTTVNTIQSGYIRTERNRALHEAEAARSGRTFEEVTATAADLLPMKRLGTVDEFGPLCAFLCSKQASYITGQSIAVDGGLLHSLV